MTEGCSPRPEMQSNPLLNKWPYEVHVFALIAFYFLVTFLSRNPRISSN
jgi:hypothetical protein